MPTLVNVTFDLEKALTHIKNPRIVMNRYGETPDTRSAKTAKNYCGMLKTIFYHALDRIQMDDLEWICTSFPCVRDYILTKGNPRTRKKYLVAIM